MKADSLSFMKLHKIYQIHMDAGDPESFIVGELIGIWEDENILVKLISTNGRWDGFCLIWMNDIVRVDIETQYINKLKRLLVGQQKEEAEPVLQDSGVETIVSFALKYNKAVGIELLQSGLRDIIGFIEKYEDDLLQVFQLDEMGREDGKTVIEKEVITRMFCADSELQSLKLLWENKIM